MLGLPSNKHMFLADTNPSDEGEGSWIWKVWFELLSTEEEECNPDELALRNELGRLDFDISDNKFDTPERIAELRSKYSHDPDLHARYILGQWVTASEDAIFYNTYRPLIHEVGEIETRSNPDPEIMVPEDGCFELLGGWDLGVSNSSFNIAEKAYRAEWTKALGGTPDKLSLQEKPGEDGKPLKEKAVPILKFLDELVIIGEVFSMEDFAVECLKKMIWWEKLLGRPVLWRHWSDRSAFDVTDPVTSRYHHQIVFDATGGRIVLRAADKGPGSVAQRVDLWKKLLFDERIYFSKTKCPKLIQMNKSIKKGTSSIAVINKNSVHKHPFDSGSYIAASEFPNELQQRVINQLLAQRRAGERAQVVAVPL
jgi:hypothetical protein